MANFNPAEWLASFESSGGAYVLTGDRLFFWIIPAELSSDDLARARALVVALASCQRAAVIQHLRCDAMVEG